MAPVVAPCTFPESCSRCGAVHILLIKVAVAVAPCTFPAQDGQVQGCGAVHLPGTGWPGPGLSWGRFRPSSACLVAALLTICVRQPSFSVFPFAHSNTVINYRVIEIKSFEGVCAPTNIRPSPDSCYDLRAILMMHKPGPRLDAIVHGFFAAGAVVPLCKF